MSKNVTRMEIYSQINSHYLVKWADVFMCVVVDVDNGSGCVSMEVVNHGYAHLEKRMVLQNLGKVVKL